VKLLFDQNVSPALVDRIADLFPNSNHVFHLGLHEADDSVVWRYAREHEFIVVSKDADFSELSMLRGFPPKLLWLRLGNCLTREIEELLRSSHALIEKLNDDPEAGILSLFRKRPSRQ
jgi:predicted nuclease of predicted toxin-antitoxin system